jgi:nicotinamide-nucleotide adenylyltransferase
MAGGLFVGRFQPFHLGHLEAVRYILSREHSVIIAVGSAQYSHTPENPFTAGERIELIHRTLKGSGIDISRCYIIPVPDIGEHRLWVSRVISFCPVFKRVYSNNGLVKLLFVEAGFEVEPVPFYNRQVYVATEIRKMMATGGGWRTLLHPAAVEYLESIECEKRLAIIMREASPDN